MTRSRLLLLAAALPLAAGQSVNKSQGTYYDLSSLGVIGNSGLNACFLNYQMGSDTTIAPNNGIWGAPKNPAGAAQCTASYSPVPFGTAGGTAIYPPNTPAPCWNNTQPTSYNLAGATYNIASVDGLSNVTHFLDFSSVLYKDVNLVVRRAAIAPGHCLPGNLVNVRTSAMQYTAPNPSVIPLYPPASILQYPTGGNQIFSTSNDDVSNGALQLYTPRKPGAGSIDVYFALNFGLRNALDNSCDGTAQKSTAACVNGGYYVSNLTTALLGDASKGLGRAHTAVIRLCHSPTAAIDRPWRKKSGDAIYNKQCQSVHQLLYGAATEQPLMYTPPNAMVGIAVNGPPLVNYTNTGVNAATGPVQSYLTNVSGVLTPTQSPIAFCRPKANASFASGVDPNKVAGVAFSASNYSVYDPTNPTAGLQYNDCVMPNTSWSVTKGTNTNLDDPSWYKFTITFSADTPKGVYFVRVFALDVNGNYLGFGSSATSANLTNTASQNYFKVDKWDAVHSSGISYGPGANIADIQAGAIGCSLLTVVGMSLWIADEVRMRRRPAVQQTEVVMIKPEPVAATVDDGAAVAEAKPLA